MKLNIDFEIKNTIGYSLAQVCKYHRGSANDFLNEIGLYTGQEMILAYLKKHDNIPQNKLVSEMSVKAGTMTKVLKRLEKSGFILRKKSKKDARIVNISLTQKGKDVQDLIAEKWMLLESITFQNFSDEERIIFRRLLSQIIQNYEEK